MRKQGYHSNRAIPAENAGDEATFLQAIHDAPEEDAPRLRYADWLERRGDPRGEFIRVQCDLVHLPENHPRYATLIGKAWALEKEHGDAWRQAFRALGATQITFRRGFPETLCISATNYLADAERLFTLAPIRCLHLCLCTTFDVLPLAACRHLARLTTLSLEGNAITAAGAAALAASPHLAKLTSLLLWGNCIGDTGAEALAASPHLAGLRTLDLGNNGITDDGALALACSPHLTNLTILNLAGNHMSSRLREGMEGAAKAHPKRRRPGNG